MTPHEFIEKWKPVVLSERATAQEHFIDLGRFIGQRKMRSLASSPSSSRA